MGNFLAQFFQSFMGKSLFLKIYFYIIPSARDFLFYLGSTAFGLNFFRASFFGYYIKECLSATPSFSLLALMEFG